ncbi:hypothetical protein B296_00006835 [Ensete ventricosum]|uniref:Uncharacterized protein n=1 Tax=Ensete ventricosum TaxID=4639 RepID=A0A427A116_ENSVE|nr:hypothetical protein B296_00006835 [Ensete ventricosum]
MELVPNEVGITLINFIFTFHSIIASASSHLAPAIKQLPLLLPHLIGKEFFRKRKELLSLDLSHSDWSLQVRRRGGRT